MILQGCMTTRKDFYDIFDDEIPKNFFTFLLFGVKNVLVMEWKELIQKIQKNFV